MTSGIRNQLTKQVGEYLVASELARNGLISATFSGNIPEFDIIATNQSGKSRAIQVKTINNGSWQFSIDRFVNIEMDGNSQIIGSKIVQPISNLICVLVLLGQSYGKDEFYIIKWKKLQDLLIDNHRNYLSKNNGQRPKAKESMHCTINKDQIAIFRDNWNIIK